jgi:16S rRNA (guanine(966)-N(2))-methyltransferase RsmD
MTAKSREGNRPGSVRIIGGAWRSRMLRFPEAADLRPTPDRVRETLFNWLGQDLTGWRCVDAFAGTGALGLEAASRGAADVLLVEAEAALVDPLRAIVKRLDAQNVRVQRGNALTALASLPAASVDLVFLDPPFEADLFDKALAAARPAIAPEGFVYLEAPRAWAPEALARHRLEAVRHMKAGAVHGHLLRPVA